MKIEKDVAFKLELNEEQFSLIKSALAVAACSPSTFSGRERELAEELYKYMCEVIKNA